MSERVVICIGTKKGMFVAEGAKQRRRFELRGPFGQGVSVYAAMIDRRRSPRIYASSCNAFFGMKVLRSTNLGKSFQGNRVRSGFPEGRWPRATEHLGDRSRRRQERVALRR